MAGPAARPWRAPATSSPRPSARAGSGPLSPAATGTVRRRIPSAPGPAAYGPALRPGPSGGG
eukprot:6554196-Alexandrium_andersonii.AAC.1